MDLRCFLVILEGSTAYALPAGCQAAAAASDGTVLSFASQPLPAGNIHNWRTTAPLAISRGHRVGGGLKQCVSKWRGPARLARPARVRGVGPGPLRAPLAAPSRAGRACPKRWLHRHALCTYTTNCRKAGWSVVVALRGDVTAWPWMALGGDFQL